MVEEAPCLLERVRYLHLNPLRAQVVPTLPALERYPWTGHSAVLGRVARPWQDTATIRAQFGAARRGAVRAHRAFVPIRAVIHSKHPSSDPEECLATNTGV